MLINFYDNKYIMFIDLKNAYDKVIHEKLCPPYCNTFFNPQSTYFFILILEYLIIKINIKKIIILEIINKIKNNYFLFNNNYIKKIY